MMIIELIEQEITAKYPALYRDTLELKKGDTMEIDTTKGQNTILEERDDYVESLKEPDDEGYEIVIDT